MIACCRRLRGQHDLLHVTAGDAGLALLVDFTGIVLSPDDHVQLAPRPVDSRMFFVARLTSVVGFSLLLTAPFALPPAVAYLFTEEAGRSPPRWPASPRRRCAPCSSRCS